MASDSPTDQAVRVETLTELIVALGGVVGAQKFFGTNSPQTVNGWRARGRIPATRMIEDCRRLKEEKNIEAPVTCWGFPAPQAETRGRTGGEVRR